MGSRYRASEGGTPIFSLLSMYMDTVPKKVRCMEVIESERDEGGVKEAEGSIISAGWVGGDFSPQGQGANLFISLEVTMKFY